MDKNPKEGYIWIKKTHTPSPLIFKPFKRISIYLAIQKGYPSIGPCKKNPPNNGIVQKNNQ